MFNTRIGPFNGKTWEDLCQLVFKLKHGNEGYQHIQADPGDFGLEGFTINSGIGFQCYCPEKHYSSNELYEKQRDKITKDIKKLQQYQADLSNRIGGTKISKWFFVTPEIDKNKLLAHAREKEKEARAWQLAILSDDFTIHLRDMDFYLTEINQVRSQDGIALSFDITPPVLKTVDISADEYTENILRKSKLRLTPKANTPNIEKLISNLRSITTNDFLQTDGFFKQIEKDSPTTYFHLVKVINEYENHVGEQSITSNDLPEELTAKIRTGLSTQILTRLKPAIDQTTADKIARHIVARWLAVCQLDFN